MLAVKIIVVIVYAAIMLGIGWAVSTGVRMLPIEVVYVLFPIGMVFAFGLIWLDKLLVARRRRANEELERFPLGRDNGTRTVTDIKRLGNDITDL